MSRTTGRLAAICAAIALFGWTARPAVAQDDFSDVPFDELTAVRFVVTLSGPVNPAHTFALYRFCQSGTCVIDSATMVCSPTPQTERSCEAGVYETVVHVAPGDTLVYALWRWTAEELSGVEPEQYLDGTIAVTEDDTTRRLGFDYWLGSAAESMLPDTAMRVP